MKSVGLGIAGTLPARMSGNGCGTSKAAMGDWGQLTRLQTDYLERIEAPYGDLIAYFKGNDSRLATLNVEMGFADLLMYQRAVPALLPGWRIVRECWYNPPTPALVHRCAVETAPGVHDFMIKYGRQFWEGPGGKRFVLDIDSREACFADLPPAMQFIFEEQDFDWCTSLQPRLKKWVDANHYLKGRAFDRNLRLLSCDANSGWDDVILPQEVRRELERNCIDLLRHADVYRANGLPLKRGIVLHGPPGTGKTMIGRALAATCGVTFIMATPGDMEKDTDVRQVFEMGRRFAPSILFFEDFDMVGRSRWIGDGKVTAEFLSCLDGIASFEGIVAIATTNDLKAIEPALKDRPNRFDVILEVPPMGSEQRRIYLQKWAGSRGGGGVGVGGGGGGAVAGCGCAAGMAAPELALGPALEPALTLETAPKLETALTLDTMDLPRLISRTDGYTGAQMQELCRLATIEAIEESINNGTAKPQVLPVTTQHFDAALRRMNPHRRRPVGFTATGDDDDNE